MMIQLNPSIPVIVMRKGSSSGQALGWIDYSPEQDLLWIVALDANGEIWIVPNNEIRLPENWSMKRRFGKK